MRQTLPTAGETANSFTFRSDSGQPDKESKPTITVQTEAEENAWFSGPARQLLGNDPGLALAVLTGKIISESSGYRYASGERPIPIIPFRQLVFRPDGAAWHGIFMADCRAQWWLETQRKIRAADKLISEGFKLPE